MKCMDCAKTDGLTLSLHTKEILCKQCKAKRNGCQHLRVKTYTDFSTGEKYTLCKTCGEKNEK